MVEKKTAEYVQKTASFEQMLIDCLGCKWTIVLLDHIGRGINRPGQLVRAVDGLTTKVLNQNLARMQDYGLIGKCAYYMEIPPRVEYQLTPFGVELCKVLSQLRQLQKQYTE